MVCSKPVKAVFRGLKNQMHVNDYWRRIIGEIIALKGSDSMGDSLVGGGGGSEPCLGELGGGEVQVREVALRKVVSTGDLQSELDTSFDEKVRGLASAVRTQSMKAPTSNFLTVPGGHSKTRSASVDSGEARLEELNEDTITSLRQFLQSAKLPSHPHTSGWVENNMGGGPVVVGGVPDGPEDSGPPTRQISRESSLSSAQQAEARRRVVGAGRSSTVRRNSVRSTVSRQSTRSGASGQGGPIGALLEQTTLGEFLTAVENVRKKSQMEVRQESGAGSRRGSAAVARNTAGETAGLPAQLAGLFGNSSSSGIAATTNGDIAMVESGEQRRDSATQQV